MAQRGAYTALGVYLDAFRRARRLRGIDLSYALGKSPCYWSNVCCGHAVLTPAMLRKIVVLMQMDAPQRRRAWHLRTLGCRRARPPMAS